MNSSILKLKFKEFVFPKVLHFLGYNLYHQIKFNYRQIFINGTLPTRLNLKNPGSFSEKLCWSKKNIDYRQFNKYVDKFIVRDIVREKIGDEYLIPIVDNIEEINNFDLSLLPEKFVAKANHGSGWNLICHDKKRLKEKDVKRLFNVWLNSDYSLLSSENEYKDIKPSIVIEKYLENDNENPLYDYKFFCFNGEPTFIQLDIDRFTNHKRNFYDLDWNLQEFTIGHKRDVKNDYKRPGKLNEMIEIARILSEDFKFVRIDLYFYKNQIYFGEITFHPEAGFTIFMPHKYDKELGSNLKFN